MGKESGFAVVGQIVLRISRLVFITVWLGMVNGYSWANWLGWLVVVRVW